MEWSWLHSLLFGLISGLAEFLPVSAEAHRQLFALFTGADVELIGFRLASHIGVLLALLLSCWPQLQKQRREQRLAAVPPRRRKRQPDIRTILDIRVLKTACIPLLIMFAAYLFLQEQAGKLWLLALLMAVNGLLLYLPRVRRSGNKDSQNMSALDAVAFGFGGGMGVVPGISRVGAATSVLQLCAVDSQPALELSLLMSIPAITVLIGFDIYSVISVSGAISLSFIFLYLLAAGAAAISAYLGIVLVRFLSVREGLSGFCYYCWGAALLTFILYLTI